MVKGTLLLTALLFVAYNACLTLGPAKKLFVPQSQWQDNLVRAQEYLLEADEPRYIMAGSSLTARLQGWILGDEFYNLSFSGGSVFTGLELVAHKRAKPEIIFVETNMIMRKRDAAILDNALQPLASRLRTYLPALREKYQPACLVAGKFGAKIVGAGVNVFERKNASPGLGASHADDDIFNKLLNIQRDTFAQAPPPNELTQQIVQLKSRVMELKSAGVRIVLVEMPIDVSLRHLPFVETIRTRLHQEFPLQEFEWIEPDPTQKYITTDGIHLSGASLEGFTLFLKSYPARLQTSSAHISSDTKLWVP